MRYVRIYITVSIEIRTVVLAELVVRIAFLGLAEDTPLNPSCYLSFGLENVSIVTGASDLVICLAFTYSIIQ